MAKKLDTEMSENERRALVRNIRQRGTEGYTRAEQQAAPTIDYAAAADQMFAGDNMQLSEAQLAGLGSGLDEVEASATGQAEALRGIFRAGQERELEYGHGYYDAMPTYITAGQNKLDEYERALAEQAAARRSSGGSRRSGSGSGSTAIRPPSDAMSNASEEGVPGWWDSLTEGQQNDWINTVETKPQQAESFAAEADAFFSTALENNMTFAQARSRAYRWLTIDLGLSPTEASALLAPYIAQWESVFAGDAITYDPGAGMGPGISGPHIPTPTAPARPGGNTNTTGPN